MIIGVRPDGRKERVAIGDGYCESKASWQELLLDLKTRGLQDGPLLAVGDGLLGGTGGSVSCNVPPALLVPQDGNVLNAMPKSQQGRAKADLQAIWMAAARVDACAVLRSIVS